MKGANKIIIAVVFLALSACGYRVEKEPATKVEIGNIPINQMGYTQVQPLVLQKKCAGCHAWGNANNYDLVLSRLGEIESRVASGNMPAANSAAGPLTAAEKEILLSWTSRGGPREATDTGSPPVVVPPAPPPIVDPPTSPTPCVVNPSDPQDPCIGFAEVQIQVLQKKCATCHGFPSTYERTFNLAAKIEFNVINNQMPPLDKEQLTDFEKTMLLTWIQNGAKEFGSRDGNNPPPQNPPPSPEPPCKCVDDKGRCRDKDDGAAFNLIKDNCKQTKEIL